MNNFTFHRPTEFVFGKDAELRAGELLNKYGAKKVLIHYGQNSVIKSGLLAKIEKSLNDANVSFVKLGGAVPNPVASLVYEGIDLCKKENVDFILAVGGGSAIDSAKAIAVGVKYDGDFWDLFVGKATAKSAIPVATVLTIPAAGSEVSASSVITREATDSTPALKRGLTTDPMKPVFSLMNPELNYTLPKEQTANGVADMMSHIFERYFTNTTGVDITDGLCESILRTIIKHAPIAIADPTNYDARANLTWAGMIAHDGSVGVGRQDDWGTHMLEHELSALYNVAHGAGLAVMFPNWMKYNMNHDLDRFVQFAVNVWGVENTGSKEEVALKGIQALQKFWSSLGLPLTFKELGAKAEDIPTLVDTLRLNSGGSFSNFVKLDMEDAKKIYELSL